MGACQSVVPSNKSLRREVERNDATKVSRLLSFGCNPETKDFKVRKCTSSRGGGGCCRISLGVIFQGYGALHLASENGCSEVVEILLKVKTSVSEVSMDRSTPLHLATERGHIKTAQLLLNHGADIEAADRVRF